MAKLQIDSQIERVLRTRAIALARQVDEVRDEQGSEYLVFRIQSQLFAIRGKYSTEVFRFQESQMVNLPGCPEQIAGVVSRRGELLPIVRTGLLLGFGVTPDDQASIMVVSVGSSSFGLQIAEVLGIRQIADSTVVPAVSGSTNPWVRGATRDGVTALRLRPLLSNGNLGFKENADE